MKAPVIELDMKELEEIIERSRHGTLSAEDQEKLKELLGAMKHLMALVENKKTSMRKLRQMLFGASTEKLENLKRVLEALGDAEALRRKESKGQGKQKAKGHGRNGADAYRGAERIKVEHESLKAGDRLRKGDAALLSVSALLSHAATSTNLSRRCVLSCAQP